MMIRSNSVITVWLMTQTAGMLLLVPVLNAQSKPNATAPAATSTQSSEAEQNGGDVFKDLQKKVTEGPAPLSEAQIASASEFGRQLGAVDWLGPLAPIALSPFFGMACLSVWPIGDRHGSATIRC